MVRSVALFENVLQINFKHAGVNCLCNHKNRDQK